MSRNSKTSAKGKIELINFEKKQVKIISVIIAAVFVFSIVALGVSQYESGMAGASSSNVGVVDYDQVKAQDPSVQAAGEKYQDMMKNIQTQMQADMANMTPEQQQQYLEQKRKEITDKQKELLDPIKKNIEDQVQAVADTRGINVVLDKNNVLYGGQDITQDVIKKLQEKGDITAEDVQDASSSESASSSATSSDSSAQN